MARWGEPLDTIDRIASQIAHSGPLGGVFVVIFYFIVIGAMLLVPLMGIGLICALFKEGVDWIRAGPQRAAEKAHDKVRQYVPPAPSPTQPSRILSKEELDALITHAITSVTLSSTHERALLVPFFTAIGVALKAFRWQVDEAPGLVEHVQNSIRAMQRYLAEFINTTASSPFTGWIGTAPTFPGHQLLHLRNLTEGSNLAIGLKGGSVYQAIQTYFEPYLKLKAPPIPFPLDRRFEHTWICGTNGSGKTTLLKRLILHDLKADKPPSIVVVEDQADLIPWLTHLDLFHPDHGKLKDKLVIFSPSQPPPPINIFDRYTGGEEGVEDTLDILRYIFGKLDIDMTGLQGSLFEPCARFLLTFPDILGKSACLNDFVRLLEKDTPQEYLDAIQRLDTNPQTAQGQARVFMDGLFHTKTFENTKMELQRRLATIGTRGYLGRMLSAQETGLNIYKLLNEGAVIAVDAAGLGESSALYGQVCITLVLQAVFARHTVPQQHRKPTFLYVDEAQKYFDVKTRNILTNARKFKMGGIFAHQQLADLKESSLEPYLCGQTSVRLVGRAPATDHTSLAAYVNARPGGSVVQLHDPQFIANQPNHHFACWIRDVTKPHAISVSADAEMVANEPAMNKRAYEKLLLNNRQKMQGGAQERSQDQYRPPATKPPPRASTPPPQQPKSPPRKWTHQDELALADAEAQVAVFRRKRDRKRVADLEQIITEAKARKKASEDYYGVEKEEYRL